MRELALHILDIAENSVAAQAKHIIISSIEDSITDQLKISIQDNGKGMDAATIAKVVDPFYTTRTTRNVGLGIPLLKAAAEACNGHMQILSQPGQGTLIEVFFQRSHIDRMPLGDLAATFLNLLISYPHIHWEFICRVDDKAFHFDDQPIKAELEGIALTEPPVLSFLRELLQTGILNIQT